MNVDNPKESTVKEHPDFRTINVTGAIGSFVGMRFEMILYSEHIDTQKTVTLSETNPPIEFNKTLECRLIIDPLTIKSIAQWLNVQINAFEKQYGTIPIVQEQQQNIPSNTQTDKKATNGVG